MIFLMNLVIILAVLYIISVQISKYNEIMFKKYRFKYFSLRDDLAMLVVSGKIKEESWEYQQLINTINFHIQTIESMSINKIIAMFVEYHTSPEEERKVRMIKKKIKHIEVISIMAEFMDVTSQLLERNSRMQIKLLNVFSSFNKKASTKPITSHKVALDKVNAHKHLLNSVLSSNALPA
jgi:hypothetical protein